MHLSEVRISGFKTFVDYTKIKFNQDLICVVGPNGCGKSNILDAIRWVLGESSNKLIRASVNNDVIFSGAKGRGQSDRASVELIFDNEDKKITWKFGKYGQISIKRELNRFEPSKYSINGQKVRRRDVVDLFMGTGLGGNSYALIQQGLISQVVESKPAQLREMIEEAAQISGYKQRRHETLLKINNTEQNLVRVSDLKTEISLQCKHLKKQAKAAKRYHELNEKLVDSQLQSIALNYQFLAEQKKKQFGKISELDTQTLKIETGITHLQTELIGQKEKKNDLTHNQQKIEQNRYEFGQKIARLEEQIKQIEFNSQNKSERKQNLEMQLKEQELFFYAETKKKDNLKKEFEQLSLSYQQKKEKIESKRKDFEVLEKLRSEKEYQFAGVESQKNNLELNFQNQVKQQTQFKQTITQQSEQLTKINQGMIEINQTELNKNIKLTRKEIDSNQRSLLKAENKFNQLSQVLKSGEIELKKINSDIQSLAQKEQNLKTKINVNQELVASLEGHNLTNSKNKLKKNEVDFLLLAEKVKLKNQPQWQQIIEAILPQMQAITLKQSAEKKALKWLTNELKNNNKVELEWFVDSENKEKTKNNFQSQQLNLPCLMDLCNENQLKLPPFLKQQLSTIFLSTSLEIALVKRTQLKPHQSILCQQGVWLSLGWLKVIDLESKLLNSPIQVRNQVKMMLKEIKVTLAQLTQAQNKQSMLSSSQQKLEVELEDARQLVLIEQTALNQKQQNLTYHKQQYIWLGERLQALKKTQDDLEKSIKQNKLNLSQIKATDYLSQRQTINANYHQINAKLEKLKQQFNSQKQELRQSEQEYQQLSQRCATKKVEMSYSEQIIVRVGSQKKILENQLSELLKEQSHREIENKQELMKQLNEFLVKQQQLEKQIKTSNQEIELINQKMAELEKNNETQKNIFYQIDKDKNTLEIEIKQIKSSQQEYLKSLIRLENKAMQKNLKIAESIEQKNDGDEIREEVREKVKKEAVMTSADKTVFFEQKLIEIQQKLDKENSIVKESQINQLSESIDAIELKLSKMGAVNLTAIENYEQSQKKLDYLNIQSDDIEVALKTLKQAISKIDNETKVMFLATFNQVNQHFSDFFPTLFNGGKARLELIEQDLLTSGVVIHAQPKGKRNKQISMLSGGEKALTAIALVLSFFSLNPAPFCLLDEVDAPLDDHNTYQFNQLIKQKSSEVQFICITHNKSTMQIASQLLGVTMKEPGVSKIVSVDIAKAIQLAS